MSKKKIDAETGEILWTENQVFTNGKKILDGLEYGDPTPVALPIGYTHPPTIEQMIAQMVRQQLEMREEMGHQEGEVEREEDFDVGEDEEELVTPYELHYQFAEERRALELRGVKFGREGDKDVSKDGGRVQSESKASGEDEEVGAPGAAPAPPGGGSGGGRDLGEAKGLRPTAPPAKTVPRGTRS